MKKTGVLILFVMLLAGLASAQLPGSTELLGPHNVGGRGCLTCHTASANTSFGASPSGASSAAPGTRADEVEHAPWGPSTIPLYGRTFAFGDGGRYVEVFPSNISVSNREVNGILICLSCHDGNLTPPSMMVGQSFEQRIGLLPGAAFGGQPIPTLLGTDSYANDHPVGPDAVIPDGEGLVWLRNTFTVVPGSRYWQFINSYGWPALVPGRHSNPWGINPSGQPFVLCVTCHNQHVMTVYVSSSNSPIASDGGGKSYPTFFFVNGPYIPGRSVNAPNPLAVSSTQFCRQCHFTESNEANNANTIPTLLQNY
jgi:hypothetical protein